MPRSRRRKQKEKNTVPKTRQSKTPHKTQEGIVRRALNHPLVLVTGLVASIVAIGGLVWQLFSGPAIAVSEANAVLPFAAPVSATNNSLIFPMYDASLDCGVQDIGFSGGGGIRGIIFSFPQPKVTIQPGETANFQCRITNSDKADLASADVFVWVNYRTWGWWTRRSTPVEVTWFTGSDPPRWIMGKFPMHMSQ